MAIYLPGGECTPVPDLRRFTYCSVRGGDEVTLHRESSQPDPGPGTALACVGNRAPQHQLQLDLDLVIIPLAPDGIVGYVCARRAVEHLASFDAETRAVPRAFHHSVLD